MQNIVAIALTKEKVQKEKKKERKSTVTTYSMIQFFVYEM